MPNYVICDIFCDMHLLCILQSDAAKERSMYGRVSEVTFRAIPKQMEMDRVASHDISLTHTVQFNSFDLPKTAQPKHNVATKTCQFFVPAWACVIPEIVLSATV
mmetsp:Transcript_31062/g.46118  ORF Transcript_31062/g.46118 Transcript_31062/m.46118 type:complete len:104 (-) Transcript_31062:1658-1969(-)